MVHVAGVRIAWLSGAVHLVAIDAAVLVVVEFFEEVPQVVLHFTISPAWDDNLGQDSELFPYSTFR
jgi:hypothetical protein